ncbi:hypothetical protein ASD11_04710 [Aeromicrobium sp. Root495]|uniref:single-stranded DNA-binding protein n=1 Tax=Aeromicrobium sp. Root495 TaxID=1736550 RepID=UPI0006FAEC26|nr:single-stranded DNA-binding protein [Aeromicrobium sp. Root495]KQY58927.1 hypothetical protein ASD11_04710 [Aeromicrobium sp. Root495]
MTGTSALNHVHLSGRISADPQVLALPSGDEIVTFRLVVERDAAARKRSKQSVDTIECVAWAARIRRSVARLRADEQVEVQGALRRRFSRGGAGVQSFASVEVTSVVALGPAAPKERRPARR